MKQIKTLAERAKKSTWRSMIYLAVKDLIDYCNAHEKQSEETLEFKSTTESHLGTLTGDVTINFRSIKQLEERVERLEQVNAKKLPLMEEDDDA